MIGATASGPYVPSDDHPREVRSLPSPLEARDEKRATGTEVAIDAFMMPGRPLCAAALPTEGGGWLAALHALTIHLPHHAKAVWHDPQQ
eukprot:3405139-Pleurochrysis_carterae.AAC.1